MGVGGEAAVGGGPADGQGRVSVVVPAFKPGAYIFECLRSLKNQSLSQSLFEIIVVLNGQRDPYYGDIESFMAAEMAGSQVSLLYVEEPGVSQARNVGIDQSAGDFICFVDDDDVVSERYLEELRDIAIKGATPLSYARSFRERVSDSQAFYVTRLYEKRAGKKARLSNTRSFFSSPCYKLIDKKAVGARRFDPSFQNGEDSLFMFAISDSIKKIQLTSKNAVYYRRAREGSSSGKNANWRYRAKNNLRLAGAYTRCFFQKPFGYSFLFYASRLLASLRNVFRGGRGAVI